jgi:hypothetical protein
MQNIEFDRRIREMMECHEESLPYGSWEDILSTLDRRKRRVLYLRRSLYGSVAVAASLLLLLFLGKGGPSSDVIRTYKLEDISANLHKPEIVTVIEKKNIIPVRLLSEERNYRVKGKEDKGDTWIAEDKITDAEGVKKEITREETGINQENKDHEVNDTRTIKTEEKKQGYGFFESGLGKVKGIFQGRRVTCALSTNLTPSVYSKSINMLSVSLGYQNDLVPSSIREYVQSQSISDSRYSMPLTFGIQAQIELNEKISVGTGLNYSLLVSNYQETSTNSRLDVQQSLHYLGIPVNVYYNLLKKSTLKLYLTGGFALDKGISANYKIIENGVKTYDSNNISGLQFSMGAGLGAELRLGNDMGLYFDPSLAYFFKGKQPESIRTAQPLQYKFELGMRFNL